MTYLWAYVAGVLTLINPCVLPLLPIVIAAAFQNSRLGPLALAAGLTLSFAALGVSVTAFGHLVSISPEVVNRAAAIVMMSFGVVLLVPRGQAVLAALAAPLASRASSRIDARERAGVAGQFGVGVLLGAVWSPCVGPTLGGAIGLAASGEGLAQATVTMLAFGVGVSTVLVALAYGSRQAVSARQREARGVDAVGEAAHGRDSPRGGDRDPVPRRPRHRGLAARPDAGVAAGPVGVGLRRTRFVVLLRRKWNRGGHHAPSVPWSSSSRATSQAEAASQSRRSSDARGSARRSATSR